jgi:lipid-A-disaccharide synthase
LGKEVVPELIQEKVTGQNIANLAMNFVMSDNTKIVLELEQIHELLNQNSSVKSAEAVMEFLHG